MKYKTSYLLISILFLISLNFILFYSYISSPKEGLHFLGRRTIEDQFTYADTSQIEQANKSIFFSNLYDSGSKSKFIDNPSYIVGGFIGKIFNLESIQVLEVERLLFSIFLLISLYKFLSKSPEGETTKLIIFFLVLFFSGLGNLLYKLDTNSPTFLIPQSSTLLTSMDSPHYILAITMMLIGFYNIISYLEKSGKLSLIFSSIAFVICSLEYPFLSPVISVSIFLICSIKRLDPEKTIIITVLSSIGLPYFFISYFMNPFYKLFEQTDVFLSPTPLQFFAEYITLFIPSVFGIEKLIKKADIFSTVVLVWLGVGIFLIFSPDKLQIKFLEGLEIPLGILAGVGIIAIIEKVKKSWKYVILTSYFFIILVPTSILLISDFKTISQDNKNSYYYNISQAEFDGLNWLKNNTNNSGTILSNWFYGNLIPGIIGRPVVVGHQILTPNFDQKISEINSFLIENDPVIGYSFLVKNNISYIFLGDFDSMLSYGFQPEKRTYLKKVYSRGGVEIYKVTSITNGNINSFIKKQKIK